MIKEVYLKSFIFVALLAYIISIIFITKHIDSFHREAFAFLLSAISLNLVVLPIEFYHSTYQVEESTEIELQLRRKTSFQFVHIFFLVLASILNNFSLFVLSFVFFLFYSVLYIRTNQNSLLNVFNFIILVLWILFLVYDEI